MSELERKPDRLATLAPLIEGLGRHGDKPAIIQVHAEGGRLLAYETVATDATRFAEGLEEAGLSAGDRVILFAAGGPDWITAFLACVAAGAVPVPLDTQTDAETLKHVLGDSAAAWALADAPRAATLEEAEFAGRVLRLDDSADGGADWRNVKA